VAGRVCPLPQLLGATLMREACWWQGMEMQPRVLLLLEEGSERGV